MNSASDEKIGAIVLAAGGSSRLGQPKQLVKYRGSALIRHAAGAALTVGCLPVVVVTGAEHQRAIHELADLAVRVRHHTQWQCGIGSSIRAGVQHALDLAPSLTGLVIMVCDQPFVTAEVLIELLALRAQTQSAAVACSYSGILGVPALFDRTLFPQLLALPDEHGAKYLLANMPEEIAHVSFPAGALDIDTPADLHKHLGPP